MTLAKRTIYHDISSVPFMGDKEVIENVPDSLVQDGLVEAESILELRAFLNLSQKGDANGRVVVRMRPSYGMAQRFTAEILLQSRGWTIEVFSGRYLFLRYNGADGERGRL